MAQNESIKDGGPDRASEDNFNDISFTENILFRKLIENSHEGITLLNNESRVVYRSPSAERISGWSWAERNKTGTTDTIHPEDVGRVEMVLQSLKPKFGASANCTFRSLHFLGHYIWLECTFTNLLNDSQVGAIVCNFRDITKRKNADELLQRTLHELGAYKYAIDESCIVAITDQRGIIGYVNKNFCKISGYPEKELIGEDHRIINSGYHEKAFIRNIWHTIANGKIWRGELKNKAKNGSYYWVDTTIVPFFNAQGKPYQYVAIRSDITERKEAEIKLIELNNDLKKQKRELEISNEELEQFAYVASHDLQEPLRMITSFLTLLEKKYGNSIDEKGKSYINYAVDGAKRMRQIILDLLEFSRVGRTDDRLELVNLNELVQDILTLFSKQIKEKKAIIEIGALPELHIYRAPIRLVFQNLISNALKYQKVDEVPHIKINCTEQNNEWLFSVADNGIGIDSEFFARIFVIFQRLHGKDKYPGTGMGLAVVKKIIEFLNGRIWLESAEGQGTTFYFTIPQTLNL